MLPGLEIGGAEMLVARLCAELRVLGCAAEVVGLTGGGPLESHLRALGVPYRVAPRRRRVPPYPAGLLAVLDTDDFDVIHGHSGTLVPLALAGWLRRVPAFYTEHGYYPDEPRHARYVERLPARLVARLVAVSPELRDIMVRRLALREPPEVVENGVSVPPVLDAERRRALRATVGAQPSSVLVGTVGRLVPVKDHASLVSAFAQVAAMVPDARLVIVGEGTERAALEALTARLGLAGRVYLAGSRADAAELAGAFDVYVSSSRSEGMPMAVLEAMAAGCAVIATNVGACAQLLEQGAAGRVVPATDPTALADAILALARDPDERGRLGAAARARAETRYSLRACARRYLDLYQRVARGRGSAA